MISSADDALRLLNKWKAEESDIVAMLVGPAFGFSFKGKILLIENSCIQLRSLNSMLVLDFSQAKFLYEEPREAPEPLRKSMEKKYVCELTVVLPSGDRCGFFERKTE